MKTNILCMTNYRLLHFYAIRPSWTGGSSFLRSLFSSLWQHFHKPLCAQSPPSAGKKETPDDRRLSFSIWHRQNPLAPSFHAKTPTKPKALWEVRKRWEFREIPIAFIDYALDSICDLPPMHLAHARPFPFTTTSSLACIRSSINSVISSPICPTITILGRMTDIKIPACNIIISPYWLILWVVLFPLSNDLCGSFWRSLFFSCKTLALSILAVRITSLPFSTKPICCFSALSLFHSRPPAFFHWLW